LSWSALVFFVVGMFVAAVVFGVVFYLLHRGVAKALTRFERAPTRPHTLQEYVLSPAVARIPAPSQINIGMNLVLRHAQASGE
jgi:hypothetical protein